GAGRPCRSSCKGVDSRNADSTARASRPFEDASRALRHRPVHHAPAHRHRAGAVALGALERLDHFARPGDVVVVGAEGAVEYRDLARVDAEGAGGTHFHAYPNLARVAFEVGELAD